MTAASYPAALAWILAREGGFVNNPNDAGGATNEGITQATLAAYRGCEVTAGDVAGVTDDEVAAIYRANYWDAIHGDDLPTGVDLSVMDCAVMSGPKRAIQWLQYAVCAAPDGAIGPHTMAAIAHANPETVVVSIASLRAAFYRQIVQFRQENAEFLQGWLARATLTKTKSLTMIGTVNV